MHQRLALLAVALFAVSTTVRLPQSVLAGGKPLGPGTYEVRITDEHPLRPDGTPNETQRQVEIVANGEVVAREIAEVVPAGNVAVATSSAPAQPRTLVQLLKGGEFVRVSVNADAERYLVYLPVTQP